MKSLVLLGAVSLCLFIASRAIAEPVISEFLASNQTGSEDGDGQRSDWIEIHNPDMVPANLAGWHLTDKADRPDKWTFPAVTLPPKGFLIVWASEKNRAVAGLPLHTNFKLDAAGEYLALTRPDNSVAREFAPVYPAQAPDVTYGLPVTRTESALLPLGVPAKAHIPADGSLGSAWVPPAFPDAAWQDVTTGVGYDAPLPPVASAKQWADSQAEFSGTQGQQGWSYGYWNRTADADKVFAPSEVILFPRDGTSVVSPANAWDGAKWDLATPAAPWTELSATGGHPNGTNSGPEHWVVRRYVSEFTGRARFAGTFSSGGACGDGVALRVFIEGMPAYYRPIFATTFDFAVNADIQAGQRIDFVMDPAPSGTDGCDGFGFTVKIFEGILADSVNDWSAAGMQTARNWSYGYFRKSNFADGLYQTARFTAFPRTTGNTVTAANAWNGANWALAVSPATTPATTLTSIGGSPATVGQVDWPVRRWTSDYTGRIRITGAVGNVSAAGDGIIGRIFLNGVQIYSKTVANLTESYTIFADVTAGSVVDFAIDPNVTETSDAGSFLTAVISPATIGAAVLADSVTDWGTGAQGAAGWNHGYYNKTDDANGAYDPGDFNSSDANWINSGGTWILGPGDPPWTNLGIRNAHPNGTNNTKEHWAIRRWTSTVSGPLTVDWHVAKGNTSGTGVTLKVFHNGVEKESVAIAGTDRAGRAGGTALTAVAVGDKIDVALTPVGPTGLTDDGADGSSFTARILQNTLPPNVALTQVADSIADWSTTGVQGYRGWTYGYYNKSLDGDGTYQAANFAAFPRDSGGYSATNLWNGSGYDWFQGNPPWTELSQTGAHPNGTNNGHEHWVIRRWASTVAGPLSVAWKVSKTNPFGSGVSVRCFHNGVEKDFGAISGADTTGITRTFIAENVAIGDVIDIALTPVGLGGATDDGADGSAFSATISRLIRFSDNISPAGNLQAQMQNVNASAYLRVPFSLANAPVLDTLTLRMKYDDGFVAHLNGTEIARRNAPVAAAGGFLADSIAEFSGTQGGNNWFYGYYNRTSDTNALYDPFSEFNNADPLWTYNGSWNLGPGDPPWTVLTNTGGHPNGASNGGLHHAIRRWVAESNGTIHAQIRLYRPAGGCDTGASGLLYHNGKLVWAQAVANADTTGFWADVTLTDVKTGDFLDLALSPTGVDGGENDYCDTTFLSMTLDQLPSAGLTWNAAAAKPRSLSEAGTAEMIDLTPFRHLLAAGTNVLAIHGLNAAAGDADFLLAPELLGGVTTADLNSLVYFLTPTPGAVNGAGSANIGPIISQVTDAPVVADADNINVTAKVIPSLQPVGPVRLRYRVMYGPEIELPMADDGLHQDGLANDGIYGAQIPASASAAGEMVRWRLTAEDLSGDLTKSPPFADPLNSPEYWGTVVQVPNAVPGGQLPVLHWFTADAAAHDGAGGGRCAFFFNGQFFDNVAADLHGQSSQGFPKKSYDFHLNTGFKLEWDSAPANSTPRINSFNLLTTYPDKANLRNLMSYHAVFEKAGVPGHWANAVQIRRNNAFHSVSHMVEDGDEDYLQRAPTLDDQGALYKMYNIFDNPNYPGAEKKSRKWEGNTDLADFMTGLNLTGVARERFLYDNAGVPEMLNYLAAQVLTGNDDCCHKNYYVYRDSEGNREWRALPWDVDLSFGRVWRESETYYRDTMEPATSIYVGLGNRFMENFLATTYPTFRQMYLRRLRTLSDTLLQPSTVALPDRWLESRLNSYQALIQPEADYEPTQNLWPTWGTPQTMAQAVDIIRNTYLPARRNYIFTHPDLPAPQDPAVVINFGALEYDPASHNQAEEYFTLTNPNAVAVDVSGWTISGAVQHTLKPGTVIPSFGTLHLSPDVRAFRARTVSPKANESRHVQGNYAGQLSARGETLTLMDGARTVATLAFPGSPSLAQNALRITEIMHHPGAKAGDTFDAAEYEFIELRNTGAVPLPLVGVKFTNGIGFTFSGGSLAPGAFAVLVRNAAAFAERHPAVTPAGVYSGALNNAGDRLTLLDDHNEEILDFSYSGAWQPLTAGQGFSLQVVNEAAAPDDWALPAQWRPSGTFCGTPGADDAVGDADGDQMPDLWEAQHGLNPTDPADAMLDTDADGQNNRAEYAASTDPNSPQSVFYLTAGGLNGAGTSYTGTFPAVGGKTYSVQASDTMAPGSWSKISDHAPAADGPVSFTDSTVGPVRRRFYRIITPQQP